MFTANYARFVPPMFKAFENPVIIASPLVTLTVKNTNFLLWPSYCRSIERILATGDIEMQKTQRTYLQGVVVQCLPTIQTLNCNHDAYSLHTAPFVNISLL